MAFQGVIVPCPQYWYEKIPKELLKQYILTDMCIGLAVSGGVDSMTLAALCSQLNNQSFTDIVKSGNEKAFQFSGGILSFKAFIVDHGARPDSMEEAVDVWRNLNDMGMPNYCIS